MAKKSTATATATVTGNTQTSKKGLFIVWLKIRAYADDTQRLDSGVYKFEAVPVRLSKLSANECEVFENEVPTRKLIQIARFMGMNPDGVKDEEILKKVVSEPKLF